MGLILRGGLSICECASCPFGFEGGMWDLLVLVQDYCLSSYFYMIKYLEHFTKQKKKKNIDKAERKTVS